MKNNYLLSLLASLILIAFSSCKQQNGKILYGQTYEQVKEIAQKEGKSFCIVLSNNSCQGCTSLLNSLNGDYNHLLKKTIVNIIDTDKKEFRWYRELLCEMAVPIICVFKESGELTAIIKGGASSKIECVEMVIDGNTTCADLMYRHPYIHGVSSSVVEALGEVLQCKIKLDKGENIEEDIENTLNKIQYPYNTYLKCINQVKQGQNQEAIYTAKQLLTFSSSEYLLTYADLFLEAKKIINPNFDPAEEPQLKVENSNIVLNNCIVGKPLDFKVKIINTGKQPLIIQSVQLSCDCVKQKSEKPKDIAPGASLEVEFQFTGSTKGLVTRYISFTSNAVNAMERVKVEATVN